MLARHPALRSCGFLLANAFRAIPKRMRFRAAVAVARAIEPLIERTSVYAARQETLRTDGLRETSLDLVLMMLTRHRIEFDLDVELVNADLLPPPEAGPLQVVTPHTMLSVLIARVLHDRGHDPLCIRPDDAAIPGTRVPMNALHPSPSLLLRVRTAYANGRTVAAMIDRGDPEPRQAIFETVNGEMRVSEALVQLAVRQGVTIVFLATLLDGEGRVVLHFERPRGASAPEIVAEFAAFVDAALRRYGGGAGPGGFAIPEPAESEAS